MPQLDLPPNLADQVSRRGWELHKYTEKPLLTERATRKLAAKVIATANAMLRAAGAK